MHQTANGMKGAKVSKEVRFACFAYFAVKKSLMRLFWVIAPDVE
jgi:hypothetical protein